MNKINFGRNLLIISALGFIIVSILQTMNLQETNYELFEITVIPLMFISVGSLLVLWGLTFFDYLDHYKTFKMANLIFVSFFFFNWVVAVIYYFFVIYAFT